MIKGMLKGFVAAGLAVALTASVAQAQKPAPEFGMQFIGLEMVNPDGPDNNETNFGLGAGNVSVAFYLQEGIAIEPTLLFGYQKLEGVDDANSSLGLKVAVPIYLAKDWGKGGGLFVAPHVGVNRMSSGGNSASQNFVGANVGTKMEISDNLFWRMQAGFDMHLENDDFGSATVIGASFGLSVYLP